MCNPYTLRLSTHAHRVVLFRFVPFVPVIIRFEPGHLAAGDMNTDTLIIVYARYARIIIGIKCVHRNTTLSPSFAHSSCHHQFCPAVACTRLFDIQHSPSTNYPLRDHSYAMSPNEKKNLSLTVCVCVCIDNQPPGPAMHAIPCHTSLRAYTHTFTFTFGLVPTKQLGMRTAGRLWSANNVGNNVKVPLHYSDGNTANYSSIYL